MQNLLKIAICAAGGSKAVALGLKVSPVTVSRYISGAIPFPADRIAWLCTEGGDIIEGKRLAAWLADREAEKTRARVLAKASA
jgi:DNA-binding transcriptional regulator YdaS (Cro superfamily)